MAKLVMMVGLQGSGKSSLAKGLRNHIYKDAIILESDAIREELFGSDYYNPSNNSKVFEELHYRLKKHLSKGATVIYDATNTNAKRRKGLLQQFKGVAKTCYFVNAGVVQCQRNNNERAKNGERSVPNESIEKFFMNLQVPAYHEGWDMIHVANQAPVNCRVTGLNNLILSDLDHDGLFGRIGKLSPHFDKIIDLAQDNPYHSLSVSRHTFEVFKYIKQRTDELVMLWTALLHDVGKPWTKNFKHDSKYANFRNHDNVGGQLAVDFLMRNGFESEFALEVANLVNLHMRLLQFEKLDVSEKRKAIGKFRHDVGEETYNRLVLLREADSQAH